jgi:uncharacterized protein with HEPN domain
METPRFLGRDLTDPEAIPYFTWDAPMTVAQLHERPRTGSEADRLYLIGKIMREARDTDVWHFTTPEFVAANFEALSRHLGQRRDFWTWLLTGWQEMGIVPDRRREWRAYIEQMLDAADRISSFIAINDLQALKGDEVTASAVLYQLLRVAYAAEHVPDEVRQRTPDVAWSHLIALWEVAGLQWNMEAALNTARNDVPALGSHLRRVLREAP